MFLLNPRRKQMINSNKLITNTQNYLHTHKIYLLPCLFTYQTKS